MNQKTLFLKIYILLYEEEKIINNNKIDNILNI